MFLNPPHDTGRLNKATNPLFIKLSHCFTHMHIIATLLFSQKMIIISIYDFSRKYR